MEVVSEEPLSHFLVNRGDFSPNARRIKPRAFLPDKNGEISVCRILGLTDDYIWDWGTRHVISGMPDNTLYGRADFKASVAFENRLRVIPDEPPPRHAIVKGWPGEKDAQKDIAVDLAAKATLVLNPGTVS
jgi:hypothetical protein